jgi:hypothetical protein
MMAAMDGPHAPGRAQNSLTFSEKYKGLQRAQEMKNVSIK